MRTENTQGIERGAEAAERAIMGYTRPDGTYVQGAVNFWDDVCENGTLIARDVLTAALDAEEMAKVLAGFDSISWDRMKKYQKDIYRGMARAVRTALLGDES